MIVVVHNVIRMKNALRFLKKGRKKERKKEKKTSYKTMDWSDYQALSLIPGSVQCYAFMIKPPRGNVRVLPGKHSPHQPPYSVIKLP